MSHVFVSSTYQDLVEHRKAVTDVLTRMRQEHSAMEFFGSRADEAVPACEKEITSCTILVGIYAWRYGWVPPGTTRSITEVEFDYARSMGRKPMLRCEGRSPIDGVLDDSQPPAKLHDAVALAQIFGHEQPFSHCVLGSLDRLLPAHSERDRLLALELAADLLKNGRGRSVAKFRRAGIDGAVVNRLMRHARTIGEDQGRVLAVLDRFPDAEVAAIAYVTGLELGNL